jgi:hypothetical protein
LDDLYYDTWPNVKLIDGLNYKFKVEDNERRRSWGMFFGSQHFGGRGVYWSFGMRTRKIDKQFNYSHSR